ncbi:TetR/AcrR family transcriptional regulator [Streptomyces sp. NPDC090445]|uniref:TetR/AcrR family transcriptional regulator n=1 Tax=Streptomyces sp. NPDC090445 TaxID=3365963 RepID=UPI0038289C44
MPTNPPPSPSTTPVRKDARRNHERVMAAAGQVFTTLGPTAQIEDVARAAGVGVGTVYRRFGSRDGLIAALVTDRLTGWAIAARAELTHADLDPWDTFARLVRSYAESCVADRLLLDIGCATVLELLTDNQGPGGLLTLLDEVITTGIQARALPPTYTTGDVITLMTALAGVAAVPGLDWRPLLDHTLTGIHHTATREQTA